MIRVAAKSISAFPLQPCGNYSSPACRGVYCAAAGTAKRCPRLRRWSVGLLVLAGLASARAAEPRVGAAEPPGRAIFDSAGCRACHRVGERGGNAGPDLTLAGHRRSPEWLRMWLSAPRAWKHDTQMPDFRLKPGDLGALVAYLAGLKGQDWTASGPPWRSASGVSAGRILFNRAGCVACHGPAGAGGHPNNNVPGGVIPALPALAATYTEPELIERIRLGKRPDKDDPSGPEPLAAMPAWGGVLSEPDLASVAAYVKSLGASAPPDDW